MAELNDQQKLRVVIALAQFNTPTEIVKEFAEEGIEVAVKQIGAYDPTRTYYEAGERWRVIFEEYRQKYLTDVTAVPIANQGFRLNRLQKSYEIASKRGNLVLAASLMRQAAEEVGGALTNERNVKVTRPVDDMTADERRLAFVELIRKALDTKDVPGVLIEAPPQK